jgi:FkbM family methyltransferase
MSDIARLVRGLAGMLHRGQRTRSQFGEDVFVRKFFGDRRGGTWLDIGAFHPKIASNTAMLRRQGWHGINVDADPVKIRLFDWFRRGDVNVCAAVSGTTGQHATLARARAGSYGSMDRVTVAEDATGVRTRTVADILAEVAPAEVDFVSIDVEGLEHDILQAYPFERYAPELFCVEVLDTTLDGVRGGAVAALLAEHGYGIVGWFPPSVFFARRPLSLDG